jgi:PHD/YefM family antitoxin component YafN of YafNO toxin-antitoxin module
MIQTIPAGINKITSARSLQTQYTTIIKDMKKTPNDVIGVTKDNAIEIVLMSHEKYGEMMRLLKEYESSRRLHEMVEEARAEYKAGKTKPLTKEWLRKMRDSDEA